VADQALSLVTCKYGPVEHSSLVIALKWVLLNLHHISHLVRHEAW
jgi:hypothetical protein